MVGQDQRDCQLTENHRDSTQYDISRLKLSSEYADFSPRLYGRNLFFVSGRNDLPVLEFRDKSDGKTTTDIFMAELVDSINIVSPKRLGGDVNNKFHQGPFCFDHTGDRLFYTSNDDSSPYPKLWVAKKAGDKWAQPEVLPFCVDTFTYCHPSLSPGDDTLWFSSNMSGGAGNMDLYYSILRGGSWSQPQNAGTLFNSPANEWFPARQGTYLSFASDREGGLGGLDIYTLNLEDSVLTHAAPPLNSSSDDFGIFFDSTYKSGYIASNRSKRTGDDLYYFRQMFPYLHDARIYPPKQKFCYWFFDTLTQQLKDTATFEFTWNFGDGQEAKGLRCRHCYSKPGTYQIELTIVQRVSGEIFTSQNFHQLTITPKKSLVLKAPDTLTTKDCAQLSFEGHQMPEDEKQTYWFFGDGTFSQIEAPAHQYRKAGKYLVSLYYLCRDPQGKKEKILAQKEITIVGDE